MLSIQQDDLVEANTYLETTRFNASHEGVRFLINSMKTQYSTDSDIVVLCDILLSLPVIETTIAQQILNADANELDIKKARLIYTSEQNKLNANASLTATMNDNEGECELIKDSISNWDGSGTEPIPYGA